MNTLLNAATNKKLITLLALVCSWSALLWINCFADLTIAMHFIAIPFLLLVTGGYAAYQLEQASYKPE